VLFCAVLVPLRAAEASSLFTNGDRGGPKPGCIHLVNAVIDAETAPQRSRPVRECSITLQLTMLQQKFCCYLNRP